jgi:V/A-type H+-transporting ATPase subunit I
MLRPQRMTATSIICIKKDVESVLETLNTFGEFHIEPSAQDDADIGEYNQNIQRVEQRLLDINGLSSQLVKEKASPLSIFRVKQPMAVQVTADNWRSLLEATDQSILGLKGEMENLNTAIVSLRQKRTELTHLRDMLACMHDLGVDVASIERFKLIHVEVASLPIKNYEAFETAAAKLPLEVQRCYLTHEGYFVCIAMPAKHREEVEKILRTCHAEFFRIPLDLPHDAGGALKEVKSRLKENAEKEKELSSSLKRLGEENRRNLDSWRETAQNILVLLEAEKKILQSGRLATIKGFVPQNRFRELEGTVHGMLKEKVLVLPNEPLESEVVEPPSKIMHSRWIKPFEEITRLYGVPKYDEIDPTPFIAITFPILFGLMFGDVGHGLVLLVGGAAVGSLIKGNQGIKNVCWIMAACGVAAMVAGVLFGEFFGLPLFEPLWFSPFHGSGVFEFLIFSLAVGIVQIVSGIVIEMVNYAVKHNWADAFLTAVPKIAFYLGGVYMIAVYQLDFAAWLSGPILIPLIPFIVMVAGKPLFLMATKPKEPQLGAPHAQHAGEHPEQDTLAGRFFEGGDFLTRLLSNTISYSRILALLMAHWALMMVIYTVAELVAPAGSGPLALVLAGIVIVFGNIFVLALEGLIVFIHTLRLHFYEWFSKFYAGTGTEFTPFKQNFVYTNLTLKDRKKD